MTPPLVVLVVVIHQLAVVVVVVAGHIVPVRVPAPWRSAPAALVLSGKESCLCGSKLGPQLFDLAGKGLGVSGRQPACAM